MWKKYRGNSASKLPSLQLRAGGGASSLRLPSKVVEGKHVPISDQYAVLVSCRCNYTGTLYCSFYHYLLPWRIDCSNKHYFWPPLYLYNICRIKVVFQAANKLATTHFKGPYDICCIWNVKTISWTRWKSLSASCSGSYSNMDNSFFFLVLNVQVFTNSFNCQVLTLQASNLTSEDLTLTVLAPASFTSPPSVVSLNSSPSTPLSPFVGFSEFTGKASSEKRGSTTQRLSSAPLMSESQRQNGDGRAHFASFNDQGAPVSDVIPSTGLGCSHLWLQSRVPLG